MKGKRKPPADGQSALGAGEKPHTCNNNIAEVFSELRAVGVLAGIKRWVPHREGVPIDGMLSLNEPARRNTLLDALEIVEEDHLDGVGIVTTGGIYQNGKRLVLVDFYDTGPNELLSRFPTYTEKSDQGLRALYWWPDTLAARYFGTAHFWLPDDSEVEICFSNRPDYFPLTFDVPGEPHPIAEPDEAALDDALNGGCLTELKSFEKPPDTALQEAAVAFPAPYPGPMAELCAAALKAAPKPQSELTTLAVVIGMAAACGSYYVLPGGGRVHLYGCGIAETGAGKDLPRHVAVLLAQQAHVRLIGKPASGPGLEDALVSHQGILIEIDELAHLLAAVNASRAPAYLIELAANLLRLFSASNGTYHTRVKADGKPPRTIDNPAVSLIGFTTPEKLGQAVSEENIADGLLGRFLFALGREDVPPRRVHEHLVLPDSVKRAVLGVAMAKNFFPIRGETAIGIDDDANQLLDDLMQEFHRIGRAATSPFAKALHVRSYEKAERIAGVLAAWSNPAKPVITPDHVQWAAQAVRASNDTVLRFTRDYMHGGDEQKNAAKLKKLLRRVISGELKPQRTPEVEAIKAGWVTRSMLLRVSKLDKKQFDMAVAYLGDLGDIEFNPSRDRPPALRLMEGDNE